MIGEIAANNASGMCCGTADNSYQTVAEMKIIFGDGTLLRHREPSVLYGICQLSLRVGSGDQKNSTRDRG